MSGAMSDYRPGDATLSVNGEPVRLRLTLGALAELEERLGGGDLSAMTRRLEQPGAGVLLTLLEALSAGGGRRLSAREWTTAAVDLTEAAMAVAKAFAALAPAALRDASLREAPQDEGLLHPEEGRMAVAKGEGARS